MMDTESLSLHQIEPLITHDEIEKIEDDEIKKEGKFRKRDILRSFCGRFTVSLVSSEGTYPCQPMYRHTHMCTKIPKTHPY